MPNSKIDLHFVSFAVPWPANYGGVINVWHTLRWLRKKGIKVHLHAWAYGGRGASDALTESVEKLSLYPREWGINRMIKGDPYIIGSRPTASLLKNLSCDNALIFFEGLHSVALMAHPSLVHRRKIFRESNVEHDYYRGLAKVENRFWKKAYFLWEANRLERFEQILQHANEIIAVSTQDLKWFQKRFPNIPCSWIPSFHGEDEVFPFHIHSEDRKQWLYQGNLKVGENEHAALYLIAKWQPDWPKLIIAGGNPSSRLYEAVNNQGNIEMLPNPTDLQMLDLLRNSGGSILYTEQPTGLKLKLLNALFNAPRVLMNPHMVAGTPLYNVDTIFQDEQELGQKVIDSLNKQVNESDWLRRQTLLSQFRNERLIEDLISRTFE